MWSHDMTDPIHQMSICQCSLYTMQQGQRNRSGWSGFGRIISQGKTKFQFHKKQIMIKSCQAYIKLQQIEKAYEQAEDYRPPTHAFVLARHSVVQKVAISNKQSANAISILSNQAYILLQLIEKQLTNLSKIEIIGRPRI